jgi:hypothetical protein
MSEEPTTSGAGDSPDRPTAQPGTNEEQPTTPPSDEEYRWFGPSYPIYAGAATPPGGSHENPSHQPLPYPPLPHQPLPYPPLPYQTHPPSGYSPGAYGQPQGPPPYSWPYVPPRPSRPPLSPEERSRRTRRALAFAGVLLVAVGAGVGIGAAIAPTSPAVVARALVSRAVTSATGVGTYHYVELSSVLGAPDDIKGDAAPNSGQQLIRQQCRPVRSATTERTSIFQLRLVHGVVYFRGNIVAIVDELGVAASRATSLAGRWVKVVKGDKPYTTFEVGITARSNASQLRSAIIPFASRTVPGSSPPSAEVVGAALRTKKTNQMLGSAVLVIDTSTGRPRSLRGGAVLQGTQRYTVTWTFSRYHEKVHVVAPPHSVPYSTLHAKPPAKTACA